MKLKVKRVDVWASSIQDRPGGLAAKLETLNAAKANLEFMIARRAPDKPGEGVVFLAPIKGKKAKQAAQSAGFLKTETMHPVRVEGPDKAGIGAKMCRALAEGGVNLRGVSAAAIGKKFVTYFAVDSDEDAEKAVKILKKL
ncbi:MAG TPA: ACT domain-containing protein [Verrucomicrobiae bacterium]|nr:ACT domain-containing protein [Verrucomicrobiae bacterium]